MSARVQELIHKFEVGSGYRILSYVVGVIAFLALAVFYDSALYRNLSTIEGMDSAQLARNIAEGRGYRTSFIRPISIFLLEKKRNRILEGSPPAGSTNATAAGVAEISDTLKRNHPELANPPVYPYLLALALKVMPFGYDIVPGQVKFSVYAPDLWITGFNQLLLLLATLLVFWIAGRLFDRSVAWLSAAVMLGTELFWRFSASGLSTTLLMVLFLSIVACLARIEFISADTTNPGSPKIFVWSAVAGLLLGLGALTRYGFALVALPAVFLIGSGTGRNRITAAAMTALVFAALFVPWLVRNYALSGSAFGVAGFSVFQGTSSFPGNELERTLRPEFGLLRSADFGLKLLLNARDLFKRDIPLLAGSWVAVLFLTGLLVPFRNVVLGRLRWFLVACLVILSCGQALGRTGLSETSPEVNSENLLVIIAPALFAYGIALLYSLLEQFAIPATRSLIISAFYVLASAPLLLAFFSPPASPIVYPPYYPPWIQQKAQFVSTNGWMISDIPWAVAWYGDRQCAWLPLKHGNPTNSTEGFYALHQRKHAEAIYLTSETFKKVDLQALQTWRQTAVQDQQWDEFQALIKAIGQRLFDSNASDQAMESLKKAYQLAQHNWVKGGGEDWQSFVLGIYINREVPAGFPLRKAPLQLEDEIFLTD